MNPYKILNIEPKTDKKGVIQAAAAALRVRRFSAREIALAQKELLDPSTRSVHDFIQFLDVEGFDVQAPSQEALKPLSSNLKRLCVFDEES